MTKDDVLARMVGDHRTLLLKAEAPDRRELAQHLRVDSDGGYSVSFVVALSPTNMAGYLDLSKAARAYATGVLIDGANWRLGPVRGLDPEPK